MSIEVDLPVPDGLRAPLREIRVRWVRYGNAVKRKPTEEERSRLAKSVADETGVPFEVLDAVHRIIVETPGLRVRMFLPHDKSNAARAERCSMTCQRNPCHFGAFTDLDPETLPSILRIGGANEA